MPLPVSRFPATDSTASTSSFGGRLLATAQLAVLFLGLWLVLSPQRDLFHVSLGSATAGVVAWGTVGLARLTPQIGGLSPTTLIRFARYLPWLGWQVVVASLRVAQVVLDPRLPVDPTLTRIRFANPSTLAKLTLANSITLTPGTVTLDVTDDEFLVHALTLEGARDLEKGAMSHRVATVFGRPTSGKERSR